MSNISIINLNAVSIYLMEIDSELFESYILDLNNSEKEKLQELKHPLKKLEFAASRYLKHQLFGLASIEYDTTGGPKISGVGYLSISHSRSHVGIAICQDHKVGLDLEEVRDKSVQLSSKFCTLEESQLFDTTNSLDMTALWSLKECLYKLSDRKKLIFKEDILVSKRQNRIYGKITKTSGIYEYELHVESFQHFLITCNLDNGKLLHEHP
ncbi:4'-phosphopantetheinyl transferase family protein [Fluviicola taffensis]|uniref:4'-phosphopantetheinyl transferase family protein n=1 Tax=Fluviicola taffensis (strain DSM 16823 / NCIMB 13979 / RW262) TaxID=755732 RepID=F2II09_FLUTR|nr:4'-phosphopantetheinyl transferase superfamily protein [Fluviicola taffensis]AEA42709.1 4'-phosphopantetheinyl transferase family protein [Fluviicola taffensis DSM 16823]